MQERQPDRINHIELAKQADLFLIAPASANLIGNCAHGLADDLISTVALALTAEVPKLIAPAMNTNMYQNPIVQRNLAILKESVIKRSLLAKPCWLAGISAAARWRPWKRSLTRCLQHWKYEESNMKKIATFDLVFNCIFPGDLDSFSIRSFSMGSFL